MLLRTIQNEDVFYEEEISWATFKNKNLHIKYLQFSSTINVFFKSTVFCTGFLYNHTSMDNSNVGDIINMNYNSYIE